MTTTFVPIGAQSHISFASPWFWRTQPGLR